MRITSVLVTVMLVFFLIIATVMEKNKIQYFLPNNIQFYSLTKPLQKQIECLAENIYFEAAHEPTEGKMAVAFVTLNRLSSGYYSDDICGVVHQKENGVCQFSWVCMPFFTNQLLTIKSTRLYNEIRDLAIYVVLNYGSLDDVTNGATYYHADYVNPGWKLPKSTQIGRHIFYVKSRDVSSITKEIDI